MAFTPIEVPPDAQQWADEAVDALRVRSHLESSLALAKLGACLNDDGRLADCICDETNWIHAPDLSLLVQWARDSYEGPEIDEPILAHIHATLNRALSGDFDLWSERPQLVAGPIRHSDGRTATLGFLFARFDEDVDWHGLFRDRAAYERWARDRGYLTSIEQLEAMPRSTLLAAWAEEY